MSSAPNVLCASYTLSMFVGSITCLVEAKIYKQCRQLT